MDIQTVEKTLSVKEAIESRHSIRKFEQEDISKENLTEIFELVRLTPSAWNLQPWRFYVVTDHQLKEKLQDAAYGQKQVTSAPAVVLVYSDMEDVIANLPEVVHPGLSPERQQEEVANLSSFFAGMSIEERGQWGLTQTNIALGFLLTAIQGLGYASVPMLGFDHEKVKEILSLPEHVKFAAMVPFGRQAAEGYEHHRFPLEKIVTFH
ncbi:nitroreductase family protein [Metabacillus malikii]|uniref:Nitroreductase n=1 Tax=Metabacillus malikii TaxID=1504265 RepID=A0ABT9ZBG5_9BACI|nr:nitroreductase family protein [Metabacillus malikii]MDQ0229562.1 nitroreductase [Metabacillus malikii]